MKFLGFLTLWLTATVTITFGSEPLWMRYPAISPDGKSIVFSYKGDLYTVPATGGKAIPVTIHKAYDFNPVWSPDSKTLVFASARFGNFDLFSIPATGGQAKRLTFFSGNEIPNSITPDGKRVLYSATIYDQPKNVQFPSGILSELYSISLDGNQMEQILTTPAEEAIFNRSGTLIAYQDRKGYENIWRKHHRSSVARDIWIYDIASGKHTKFTNFAGEDRDPVFDASGENIYYLSEESGSFNVFRKSLNGSGEKVQISHFSDHPVRFLTISDDQTLCYGYDGKIYTQRPGQEPVKVPVEITLDTGTDDFEFLKKSSGATEMDLNPDGHEIAFVLRGEVFVTSVDYKTTKRVTDTPEQERSVDFSPDGRSLVYASERDGSWNLYISHIVDPEEKYFASATVLHEEPLLISDKETFQPRYSPNGKEVAFLEERTELRVINLKTREIRTILPGNLNYSYSDGDQWYQWSPDGKWFLVSFSPYHWTIDEAGLVSADASGKVVNLTKSGYSDNHPKWVLGGNAMLWFTDRNGMRSHGSWGATRDAYAMFFNEKTYDRFKLTEEEFKLLREEEKKNKKSAAPETGKKKNPSTKGKKAITINLNNLEDRTERLTIHSSDLSDAILSPEGDKLYYLSKFEEGYDLWLHDLKKDETKLLVKLSGSGGSLHADTSFKNLYVFAGGKIFKIDTKENKKKAVTYEAELNLNHKDEREYLFEHVWRQVLKKFYTPDLHGVDWAFYKKEYAKFLPHINNNFDFAEMLSEMLGELNGSHTGSGYRFRDPQGDQTAALGLFLKKNERGMLILEVMDKSPVISEKSKIKAGVILTEVNGEKISGWQGYFRLLNHRAGKPTRLKLFDPDTGKEWEETVKPVTLGAENELKYERWVRLRREETERISHGKIGYVHIREMNSSSFRVAYSEILGRNHEKEAIVVDTRFNGGGWLHDDLATLLGGKRYADYYPGGTYFGSEPIAKWYKPSIVLVSESNYSDAHGFPYAYRALGIGKIVGMPVPGTMTAVWWETLQDNTLYFGIPQIGTRDQNGNYLENQQLEPDYKVPNLPETVITGTDSQLKKAVEVLLREVESKNP